VQRSISLPERRPAPEAERSEAPPVAARAAPAAAHPAYRPEALVVIDLVKSSDLVSRFGNSFFYTLKQKLEQLVTPIVNRYHVSYAKDTGDGFLLCFPSIADAAGAVREIFKVVPLLNRDLPEDAEAAFRAGLNYGEVVVERDGGNRTGTAVHKTFRLQGVGPDNVIEVEGGVSRDEVPRKNCVFVSEEALSGVSRLPDCSCRFLGLTELKGLPGLHRVYQLEWR
jgi:adenylate cyclase